MIENIFLRFYVPSSVPIISNGSISWLHATKLLTIKLLVACSLKHTFTKGIKLPSAYPADKTEVTLTQNVQWAAIIVDY